MDAKLINWKNSLIKRFYVCSTDLCIQRIIWNWMDTIMMRTYFVGFTNCIMYQASVP